MKKVVFGIGVVGFICRVGKFRFDLISKRLVLVIMGIKLCYLYYGVLLLIYCRMEEKEGIRGEEINYEVMVIV